MSAAADARHWLRTAVGNGWGLLSSWPNASGSGSSTESTTFKQWAGAPGMGFEDDASGDGLSNGMAFLIQIVRVVPPIFSRAAEIAWIGSSM
jgi:hypothetical protein